MFTIFVHSKKVFSVKLFTYLFTIQPSKNVFLLTSFVVAIKNSTLLSSCCDKNRSAEISANVQPPKKNTNITRGMSNCEDVSLVKDPLLLLMLTD